jgi:hypothetical protein
MRHSASLTKAGHGGRPSLHAALST